MVSTRALHGLGTLVYTNGSKVYPLSFSASNQITGNSSSVFCVAKDNADTDKLKAGLISVLTQALMREGVGPFGAAKLTLQFKPSLGSLRSL
ncbi:hypothetical protein RIF29_13589 [Crotalaria pallida]|uniref:Uncharacterized protein n=1 Tax=Crotalaria pallida TaxID=3830 RepID=A0AAN9IPL7_CROPI